MNASRGLPRAQSRGFASLGLILFLVIGLAVFAGGAYYVSTHNALAPGPGREATLMRPSVCPPAGPITKGAPTQPPQNGTSGITGRLQSYGCPAQRVGEPCGTPLPSTKLSFYRGDPRSATPVNTLAGSVVTGADARFSLALSPGIYWAKAEGLIGGCTFLTPPDSQYQTIAISVGSYASTTVSCDNGIR